ncbi:MAG TPA: glycosyltransferase [Candidatus Saccharimonadales bacterium]|nr:glycosyltransferase [Candidatus Saccharimonadales bacterium]
MRLVVIVPTYNEKDNVEEIIKKILSEGKNFPQGTDLHVLISDSHSPDGTGDVVKKITKTNPKVHYIDVKERGLGIGLVKGHRYAIDKLKADVLAQMDADLSHDPSTLPQMLKAINEGYDLVNGSRLAKGGHNLLGWHRRLFTRGSALYCKLTWGTFKLSEFTNSYRVFTKKLFEKIDFTKIPWKSKTYIIQPAFLYAAIKAGAKIKEIPITFTDRKNGYSKAKIVSYTLDVLIFGLKVRLEKSKTIIKFLIVGTTSYFLSATILGLLYRGEAYVIPFLSKIPIRIFSKPLLSAISETGTNTIAFISLDRLFVASIIAIEVAIIYNFFLHENWTFKDRSHTGLILTRLFKFNLSSIASPIIQIVTISVFANVLRLHEQIGLAVGVFIGLFVNYFVNILWIWKAQEKK